jgi:colanic acid biosynthesis glycosyl transferase WcaI
MRILVLAINYWPEQTGIGAVLTRRCEYLASVGHEVTVCTSMPYYPEWRIHQGYAGKLFFLEEHNGVTILRSWVWLPKRVTSSSRVLFEASFVASSLLRTLRNNKPDVLLVVSPPLGLGMSAVLLSRWWKIPYVFDVQDLQPDAAAELGMLPRPVLPILYWLEAMAYRNAAFISTVTETMRKKIISKGISTTKVVVVPPPADNSLFGIGSVVEGHKFREKYCLDGKFIVTHSGNMGVKQGLDVVLDAALLLRKYQKLIFILAGDGVMKSHLESRATALNLNNVRFLPLQAQGEYLQMLAAIDVALLAQQSTVSDIAFPSKAVTLLSAARPVAASVTAESEIGRILRQSGAGVVTEPEKADVLATTIEELFHNPRKRSIMGERGRQYAMQHWHEAHVLPSFEAFLLKAGRAPALTLAEEPAF